MNYTEQKTLKTLEQGVSSVFLVTALLMTDRPMGRIREKFVDPGSAQEIYKLSEFIEYNIEAGSDKLSMEELAEVWDYAKGLETLAKVLPPPPSYLIS